MLNFIKGFLLFIFSIIGNLIIFIFGYTFGLVSSLRKKESGKWHTDLARGKDQYINGVCKYLFNRFLIHSDSLYKFGNIDETISSVIGKNKIVGSLSLLGRIIDKILDLIEKDHTLKSIDKTEY